MTDRTFDLAEPVAESTVDDLVVDAVNAAVAREGSSPEHRLEAATDRARAAAAAVSVAQAELVDAVREICSWEGALSNCTARQWVSWQCGLTTGETRQLFALAGLDELPGIDAAFRAGGLSAGVAETMATVATPQNEAVLLDAAHAATGQQLQVLVRDFRSARKADRGNRPVEDDPAVAPSSVSAGWSDDGRYDGRFSLRPDEGAVFEAAISAGLAKGRKDRTDAESAAEDNPVVDGVERAVDKAPRVTKADVLVDLARGYLANHADDLDRLSELYQVIVHRDLDGGGHPQLSIPGCGTLDARLAELVACDSIEVTQDMIRGFPVSKPTRHRLFNAEQRRSMRARDRTCRYPGCGQTRHLRAHHTIEYADSHQTSVADGVMLCDYHHWLLHKRKATLTLGVDHVVTITRPDGSRIRGSPRPPPPPRRIAHPAAMPTDRRRTGTGEHLTHEARDCYLDSLHRATAQAS